MLVTVAAATRWGPASAVDHGVARWAYDRTYGNRSCAQLWLDITHFGQPIVLRLGVVLAAAVQGWLRRWGLAAWLLATAVAENVAAPLSKFVLSRPRPRWYRPITDEHGFGYPSGHATAAAMFLTAVALLVLATVTRLWLRVVLVTAAGVVATLVAASRVFLGVHYLTDVVGGLLLGTAVTLLTWAVFLRLTRRAGGGASAVDLGPSIGPDRA